MNAAMLFARALDRGRELDVRIALGAGSGRVIRLLLSEATVLAIAGGLVGVLIAYGSIAVFLHHAPASIPRLDTVAVDRRVLAAAAAVSLGAEFDGAFAFAVRDAGVLDDAGSVGRRNRPVGKLQRFAAGRERDRTGAQQHPKRSRRARHLRPSRNGSTAAPRPWPGRRCSRTRGVELINPFGDERIGKQ
jgi:hypothetical protein